MALVARFLRLWRIPWPTLGLVVGAYLLLPVIVFAFFFLDLFAKAPDFSLFRLLPILSMAVLTGGFCCYLAEATRAACSVASPMGRMISVVLVFGPTLHFLVLGLDFVDWMPVYLSALTLPILLLRPRHQFSWTLKTVLASLLAILVLGNTIRSQLPAGRLERYTLQLEEGCWCCDYKSRAVLELCALGPAGRQAVVLYTRSHPEEAWNVGIHLPAGGLVAPDFSEARNESRKN